eukprot:TRINITY_DN100922_c0_g1_i1.p1 TRINITY_DN100922_c0_g1~~TRINITY_DN100922_c0_g1_i1.p1  ORF type:complete len:1093 (+),score=259.98 TRINITY_DN100922_c0_g1_i1:112-3390(+)
MADGSDDEPLVKRPRTEDAALDKTDNAAGAAQEATAAPAQADEPDKTETAAAAGTVEEASAAPSQAEQPAEALAKPATRLLDDDELAQINEAVESDDEWDLDWKPTKQIRKTYEQEDRQTEDFLEKLGHWPTENEGVPKKTDEGASASLRDLYRSGGGRLSALTPAASSLSRPAATGDGPSDQVAEDGPTDDAPKGPEQERDEAAMAEAERADVDMRKQEVEPDLEWRPAWSTISPEGLVALLLVQKIRGRSLRCLLHEDKGEFPGDTASAVISNIMLSGRADRQYLLIAALTWVEAQLLEGTDVPPNLGLELLQLLDNEEEALKLVVARMTHGQFRRRGVCRIPPLDTRRDASDEIIPRLRDALYDRVKSKSVSREDIENATEDALKGMPLTVKIVALVHALEYSGEFDGAYRTKDTLVASLKKICLLERAMEAVCRLTLKEASDLALDVLDVNAKAMRGKKIEVMNRMNLLFKTRATEDELISIHLLPIQRQLLVMLNVERDIELMAAQGMPLLDLNFEKLARPHINEKLTRQKLLTEESGHNVSILELAQARSHVNAVLKVAKASYGWSPQPKTKHMMFRVNWLARLSSLLYLLSKSECLDADTELRKFLRMEVNRKLHAADVLLRYDVWHKIEQPEQKERATEGDRKRSRVPRVLDPETSKDRRKLYDNYVPEDGLRAGYKPMAPPAYADFGPAAGAIPGTPLAGSMTPGGQAPPGTPAFLQSGGSGTMTPGVAGSMTPASVGGGTATPGMLRPGQTPYGPSGTVTPAFRKNPATPGAIFNPPPGTPGTGFTPQTPGFAQRPQVPGTPFAAPSTPSAAFQGGGNIPRTPMGAGGFGAPQTPGAGGGNIPRTPVGAGGGPGIPRTPMGAGIPRTPVGAGGGAGIPRTPMGAGIPRTPMGAGGIPRTPVAAGTVPRTPGGSVAGSIPRTPIGATIAGRVPKTPGDFFVPSTPMASGPRVGGIPRTPMGGSSSSTVMARIPITPAGLNPPTPFGSSAGIPRTPVNAAAGAPAAPGEDDGLAVALEAPATPAAAALIQGEPAVPAVAPETDADEALHPATVDSGSAADVPVKEEVEEEKPASLIPPKEEPLG